MVGTLSNPNFMGIYLLLTSMITLGLMRSENVNSRGSKVILFIMFLAQALVILMSDAVSSIIGLALGIFLTFTTFWEVKPGRVLKTSPFFSGAIIAIFLTLMHGIVYYSTSSYPWENLAKPPHNYMSIVSRLTIWQMGYAVFLENPIMGIGPGAMKFAMPSFRPNYATSLGLRVFNEDPHSATISLLAETGIVGLFAFATLAILLTGIGIRKVSCEEHSEENNNENHIKLYWFPGLVPFLLTFIFYYFDLVRLSVLFFSIPAGIALTGIINCLRKNVSKEHIQTNTAKAPVIALILFVFHSLFNNNLSIIPLLSTVVIISSLVLSNSLRDPLFKRIFSLPAFTLLLFPAIFAFTAYNLQGSYQTEQMMLFSGARNLSQGKFDQSKKAFETAIKVNPQSLRAYFGLAMSLKHQHQLEEAQNILEMLDKMVANIFNSNFELAKILFERKHLLEAHRYALRSLKWNATPGNFELLGNILLSEGKQKEAKRVFKEGLVFIPDNSKAERLAADRIRLNLAAMAANIADYETCDDYLKQIKTSIKQSGDWLYLSGLVLSEKGKTDQALQIFEKALKMNPENPRIMNAVGYLLTLKDENLKRAQKLLENAYQILKSSDTPMLSDMLMVAHSLGKLYWKQKKLDKAERLLEISWNQSPDSWTKIKAQRFADYKKLLEETNRLHVLDTSKSAPSPDQESEDSP
jgi:tetratricopeptide (TPR) repeat protein